MPYSVEQVGTASQGNSSTATLLAAAVFTGTGEEVVGYATVSVFVFASHVSATDGLSVQWSSNNTNWDESDTYTVPAATGKAYTFGVQARYVRVVYTNGGTNQTAFRLQTLYHDVLTKASSHRLGDAVTPENDAELVLAAQLTGQGKTLQFVVIAQGAAGTTALVSADTARKIKVVSYAFTISAAGTAKFTDGTADLTGAFDLAANGGAVFSGQPSSHAFETAAINRPLNIVTTVGAARGHLSYFLEA